MTYLLILIATLGALACCIGAAMTPNFGAALGIAALAWLLGLLTRELLHAIERVVLRYEAKRIEKQRRQVPRMIALDHRARVMRDLRRRRQRMEVTQ